VVPFTTPFGNLSTSPAARYSFPVQFLLETSQRALQLGICFLHNLFFGSISTRIPARYLDPSFGNFSTSPTARYLFSFYNSFWKPLNELCCSAFVFLHNFFWIHLNAHSRSVFRSVYKTLRLERGPRDPFSATFPRPCKEPLFAPFFFIRKIINELLRSVSFSY